MKNRFARNIVMSVSAFLAFAYFGLSVMATANAASDQEIIRGFNLTVFGSEFSSFGLPSDYIRKYSGPVRFKVHNFSAKNRTPAVHNFIKSLNRSIAGLETRFSATELNANFNVYVVDRKDYLKIAREKVYRRPMADIPGKCLVRSIFSRNGIIRSDAVIVSDEGEDLFARCMAEEILQGLGPLNEHPTLRESMFNDLTKHTRFTRYDRLILNMLYDRRIKNGASRNEVKSLLPDVLKDAKQRLSRG